MFIDFQININNESTFATYAVRLKYTIKYVLYLNLMIPHFAKVDSLINLLLKS